MTTMSEAIMLEPAAPQARPVYWEGADLVIHRYLSARPTS